MIKKLLTISIIGALTIFGGCKKNKEEPKEWTRGSDFEGAPRSAASSFILDGKAYITGGFDGEKRLTDLRYYDPQRTNWYKVEGGDFPGTPRNYAVAFSINGKAYVGTGSAENNVDLDDFYQFDPNGTPKWKPIAKFPGGARYAAVAFSANGKGYVGSGTTSLNGDLKDFYCYDPVSDKWTQITSIPSYKRGYAFTFTIGDTPYVGGGINNGSNLADFWLFNAKASPGSEWVKKNDLNRDDNSYKYNLARYSAATFAIGNRGYIVGGNAGGITASTWAYDPASDSWDQHQDLAGSARDAAIGFSFGDKGYITTGKNGSRFDDLWVFSANK